jgi:hypothetical protein
MKLGPGSVRATPFHDVPAWENDMSPCGSPAVITDNPEGLVKDFGLVGDRKLARAASVELLMDALGSILSA